MKTQLNASPIFTQGVEKSQVSLMDMDLDGMKQACQIFRDNIYTNKIRAVVREWSCNAIDEHVKHKINRPVALKIENNRFSVRDFAQGLDDNGIRNVFGKYFRSTKSNSDQPIGGFGVGAKAGHCYNDTFYVTSFFNGIKTIYSCILGGDESGASIGQVVELNSEPTDETGLLIEIEIKSYDSVEFQTEALIAAAMATLTDVEVQVGGDTCEPATKKLIHEQNGIKFFQMEKSQIPSLRNCDSVITMGGVLYKLPDGIHDVLEAQGVRFKNFMQIDVPVGYFDVPISRESFRKTPKFDINFKKCADIINQMIESEAKPLADKPISFYINNKNLTCSDVFSFKPRYFINPKVAMILSNVSELGEDGHPLMLRKEKHVVCVLSNQQYTRAQQIGKIKRELLNQKVKVFCVHAEHVEKFLAEAPSNNDLIFAKIQSCFPQTKSSNKHRHDNRYQVRASRSVHPLCLNALELHNHIFDSNCADVASARQMVSDYQKEINSHQKLPKISVHVGMGMANYKFTSKALAESLFDLGYWNASSPQYIAKFQEIAEAQKKVGELVNQTRQHLNVLSPFVSRKTIKKAEAAIYSRKAIKPSMIRRLQQMEKVIKIAEQTQDPILNLFIKYTKSSPYFCPCRKDMRKVLKKAFCA
jgi:hypothetical protein